jgi:hypothetical protein
MDEIVRERAVCHVRFDVLAMGRPFLSHWPKTIVFGQVMARRKPCQISNGSPSIRGFLARVTCARVPANRGHGSSGGR